MNCNSCGQNIGSPVLPLASGIPLDAADGLEIRPGSLKSDYKQMADKFVQWMNANVCGGFVDELPNALKEGKVGGPLVT